MKLSLESRTQTLWLICLAGFALVAVSALRAAPQIADLFLSADGDDQMRLVEVRDWLAGQSWFDVHQYRVLPPEGIAMHWSRYLDVGIAAVLTAAGWVLPASQAELATLILWPSFLACLMVLLLARSQGRLFGLASAVGALAVFLGWGKLGGEFVAPRIDHHNVQILCTTAAFYLALLPRRPALRGALAGLATAMALAVGLEMLPALAVIWGFLALRHAFGEEGAGRRLVGFGLSFAAAAPLLMIGQTARADWTTLHCDVLAPPVIALGAVGVVATLTPVLAARWLRGPLTRLLVLGLMAALGLWLAHPLLGHCLAGPYAQVPPEVRAIIEQNVAEARSAVLLLQQDPDLLARVLGPPTLIGLLALPAAWALRKDLTQVQRTALIQAFLVLAAGLAFGLVQIRAANLTTPAVPLIGGFLLHGFVRIPRTSPARAPAAIALLLALPTTVETAANRLLKPGVGEGPADAQSGGTRDCRTADAMAEIASLPQSVLFTTLNIGPAILAFTPHSVTSASYHRSPQAFWNGIGAFQSETDLRDAVAKARADYLVLCADGAVETGMPTSADILSGRVPTWLTDVTEDRRQVRVYRVDPTIFPATDIQP